jgi:hypothetical protein
MTFRDQVRLAWLVGVGLLGLGLVLIWIGSVGGTFMAIGVAVIFFGGVVRPVQRWQWMSGIRRGDPFSAAARRRVMKGPTADLWRTWLGLPEAEGTARD